MNKIKNIVKNVNSKRIAVITLGMNVIWSTIAYADAVDKVTTLIASYAQKGGGLMTFIGILMGVAGYKSENPGEMDRGIKTAIAGVMTVAVATGYKAWLS